MLIEQAQLGPDQLKKPRTGSVWTDRLGSNQLKKSRAGRPFERYSHEGIYLGVSVGAHL